MPARQRDNRAMKVFDLQCAHEHSFEGWFASEADFQDQLARSLIECPLCDDRAISKKLSAPRLHLNAGRAVEAAEVVHKGSAPPVSMQELASMPADGGMQAEWLKMMRHLVATTEDVGSHFAEEARRIHYGESEVRNIRGQASTEETLELMEEGIAVMPLSLPKALKDPQH
jgi:hypothetical protein